MDEKFTDLIIRELGKHRSRNELIRSVCEQGAVNWQEAERLIKQVEEQNKRKIAARRSPLLLFLSFGILVIGVALLIYNLQFFIDFFQRKTLDQLLGAYSAYYRIAGLLTGFGMIVGGLIGVWQTLSPFFEE